MDNVKVRLSISLPGGVMYSKQECFKKLKKKFTDKKGNKRVKIVEEPISEMFEYGSIRVKDDKTKSVDIINYKVPKCKPAMKTINLTSEAYNYMISSECPAWVKPKQWNAMNKRERLENHLKRIADHNRGTVVGYQVLDD